MIGPSIAIRGQLAGREDLVIQGTFEGEIQVPGHTVTIGSSGKAEAEIRAKVIIIEGNLTGNLIAEEQVVVRASGQVKGDIQAPRVGLEEGCQFVGRVDMDPQDKPTPASGPRADADARTGDGRSGRAQDSGAAGGPESAAKPAGSSSPS